MLTDIPRAALWSGFAGLAPLAAGAAGLWLLPDLHAAFALYAMMAYAAVMLAFLGAVHLGVALVPGGGGRPGWSVAPALIGWVAQMILPVPGLILLIVGFWASFMVDARAVRAGTLPVWYGRLRRPLAALAVLFLGLALFAVW
ncbi:MAG: DUF3429 domain-containing protein [Rhodospirillales bacterium]|nr:DUF3429 domain-containing protein [Rhodospirillales bacterium]